LACDSATGQRLCHVAGAQNAPCLAGTTTGQLTSTPGFVTQTRSGTGWSKAVFWCPGDALPALNQAAIRAQALRLLPPVSIGSAWTTTALANAETLLWADTPAHRRLPTVHLLGRTVALELDLVRATWDFGDGHADTTSTPGKPYDQVHDPCRSAQCPDYYGHTYTSTGIKIITLAVTWHAAYSLDGHTWNDIDTPIAGPARHHTLRVLQARAILVPNPGDP